MTNSQIVAKAVVLNPSGEVLLLRRAPHDPNRPGEWDFPGGGIENDEAIEGAVRREVFEETGLDIGGLVLELLYTTTELKQSDQGVVHKFLYLAKLAEFSEVTLSPEEHDYFEWQAIESALEMFPHPFYGAGLRFALEQDLLN